MNLYEFLLLDDHNKFQTVWDKGTYIDTIFQEGLRINLYAIDRFFVEIYYNPELNKIVDKKAFIHGHSLDKYSNLNL